MTIAPGSGKIGSVRGSASNGVKKGLDLIIEPVFEQSIDFDECFDYAIRLGFEIDFSM